jgi:hypothetical protein
MPRIRSKLAKIDPRSAAWTTRIWFAASKIMNRINSTALPKDTFSKAPSVSPSLAATLSVAWASIPARGMIAIAFMEKMMTGFRPAGFVAIPMGTKTSRTLSQV